MLWVPRGFAHDFEVFSDEVSIKWETEELIVSKKDSKLMSFECLKSVLSEEECFLSDGYLIVGLGKVSVTVTVRNVFL